MVEREDDVEMMPRSTSASSRSPPTFTTSSGGASASTRGATETDLNRDPREAAAEGDASACTMRHASASASARSTGEAAKPLHWYTAARTGMEAAAGA